MSGNKSKSRRRTPPPQVNLCQQLVIHAVLNSAQPPIFPSLKVGDHLQVRLQTVPTPGILVEFQGKIAGSLTGLNLSQLVNCLQNGYQFVAEVESINGGKCQVKVTCL